MMIMMIMIERVIDFQDFRRKLAENKDYINGE